MTAPRPKAITRRVAAGLIAAGGASALADRASAGTTETQREAAWRTLPPTPTLPHPNRSGIARVNGAEIHFAQFGAGPPVLLLHGGLGSSRYWGAQVAELQRDHLVTVMDTRGHGRSRLSSLDLGFKIFAADASALLAYLGLSSVSVIGWSDGGITALQLAIDRSERVSKVFAFGANSSLDAFKPGGAQSPTFAAYAARCKSEYAELSPEPERWGELVAGMRKLWRSEPTFSSRDLGVIAIPTTIACGAHDEIIRRDHFRSTAAAIPKAQFIVLDGVSHFAMLQKPEIFNRELSGFLMR